MTSEALSEPAKVNLIYRATQTAETILQWTSASVIVFILLEWRCFKIWLDFDRLILDEFDY